MYNVLADKKKSLNFVRALFINQSEVDVGNRRATPIARFWKKVFLPSIALCATDEDNFMY